jgi:hypothetical protein
MTIKAEHVYDYTLEQWEPLLDLIPAIEQTSDFGKISGGGVNEDQTISLPYYTPSKIVQEFLHTVYDIPIIIPFDWAAWDEGRKMAQPDFDLDSVDLITKCKLITAIVRNDRFCEGALDNAFVSGLILRILTSIEHDVHKT